MPPSLQLPFTYRSRDQVPGWPLTLVFIALGAVLLWWSPRGMPGAGVAVLALALGWPITRLLDGQTRLDIDGVHLRSPWGRRTTVAWQDVLEVTARRNLLLRSRVRTAERSYTLFGMPWADALALREALAR